MTSWLVTGGAGFIGSSLVRRLLADGAERVVVLDALTYAGHLASLEGPSADARFRFLRGDVASPDDVATAYREARPDVVAHLAAESHVDRSIDGPGAFVRTNVTGTYELLEGARRWLASAPAPVRTRFRFLHVSTDEVFGSLGATGRFTEDSPYAPRSPYAASKAAGDHLVAAWHATYGLPTLVTNTSNNLGPRQHPEKLIPLVTANALEGRPLPVYGDGAQVRDWIHVDDHVDGLLAAVARGRPGGRYNLGARAERTNLEVVHGICDALERLRPAAANPSLSGRAIRTYRDLVTHVEDRPGHDRRYAIDSSRAERELGWKASTPFERALESTVAWYVANRAWHDTVAPGGEARARRGLGAPPVATRGGTR